MGCVVGCMYICNILMMECPRRHVCWFIKSSIHRCFITINSLVKISIPFYPFQFWQHPKVKSHIPNMSRIHGLSHGS